MKSEPLPSAPRNSIGRFGKFGRQARNLRRTESSEDNEGTENTLEVERVDFAAAAESGDGEQLAKMLGGRREFTCGPKSERADPADRIGS